jgi:phage host-nuclease inhibitor protein Gam
VGMDVNKIIATVEGIKAKASEPTPAFEESDADLVPGSHGWTIENLGQVDRSLARMRELETRRQQNAEIAKAAVDRVERWLAKQNAGLDFAVALHAAKIGEYAEGHRKELLTGAKKGAKSRSFPNGRVGWRNQPEKFEVTDKDALVSWALRTDPDGSRGLVDVSPRPVMAEIKRYAGAQMPPLIPPGVTIEHARENLQVVPAPVGVEALATQEDE